MESETFFSKETLMSHLSSENKEQNQMLFDKANETTYKIFKNKIYLRALIEFSNVCEKNCFYCGLRCDHKIERFTLDSKQIIDLAMQAFELGIYSIVLQSGECSSPERISFLTEVLSTIKTRTKNDMAIVLSIGELSKQNYEDLHSAGADRFLLRIETSNPILYRNLHPSNHSFQKRLQCLSALQKIGYQVGTGVMFGLPGQTYEDLANDLLFFQKQQIDMVGMGPYIPHPHTPLWNKRRPLSGSKLLSLSYKMIALLRLMMPTINIASTGALEMLSEKGRINGLLCGANVIMPRFTPISEQFKYQLYKRDLSTNPFESLLQSIEKIGKTPFLFTRGDSIFYQTRRKKA